MANEIAEKRRFFRIDDTINLSYQLIDEETVKAGLKAMTHAMSSEHSLGATLDVLSQESLHIMQRLEKQNDPLLELYKILDAKINAVAQAMMFNGSNINVQKCQDVNLSASGVAFFQEDAINIGQYLAIEMYLPSTLAVIMVYGQVIKCERLESEHYAIAVDFTEIRPDDQELLIKHVVRKQWQQLQEKRALSESTSSEQS